MHNDPFRSLVRSEGVRLYRDLPWRRTRDPYKIWLSEVMLQQTQVARVETRWQEWLDRFPTVSDLAAAPVSDVLAAWQGMGYNRRALSLKKAAETIAQEYDGAFPRSVKELVALPGIGPATAQGIRSFAFDLPGVYLETNVRTVVLHHLFPDASEVSDKELTPIVEATCPAAVCTDEADEATVRLQLAGRFADPQDARDTPRAWYYAMLDYGAYLKKAVPNPSRRAKAYTRQSKFEGSRRQKRAEAVRMLLEAQAQGMAGVTTGAVSMRLTEVELAAGRPSVDEALAASILEDLEREGFCCREDGAWRIV